MQVPGERELELVLMQVHLTLGGASIAAHNKWLATMGKLFARIRAAALAAHTRVNQRRARAAVNTPVTQAPPQAEKAEVQHVCLCHPLSWTCAARACLGTVIGTVKLLTCL